MGYRVLGPREETLTLPFLLHSWDRKNNPEPWNRLSPNDQYKVPLDGSRVTPPILLPPGPVTCNSRTISKGRLGALSATPFPSPLSSLQFPLTIRS